MARVDSPFHFSGTIGNLTIYRVGNKCYARTKSSLDRKRFQKDPAFAKSREKAAQFGAAARLVKAFYQQLPAAVKRHGLFGQLTAIALNSLQAGENGEKILQQLQVYCGVVPARQEPVVNQVVKKKGVSLGKKLPLSRWRVNTKGRLVKSVVQARVVSKALYAATGITAPQDD